MDKNNLKLFKQAISDGLSKKFDSVVNSYTDEIVCSEQHNLAMRTIVYGKADAKRTWSPKMKRIVAILVAAALLLTSCAVIFRNEIREIVDEFFVKLTYDGDNVGSDTIEEVYELGYLPEGYYLEKESITPVCVQLKYINKAGDHVWFEQTLLAVTDFYVDSENGYTRMNNIQNYEIYYRYTNEKHVYVWNDGKYSIKLYSINQISTDELILILEGIIK